MRIRLHEPAVALTDLAIGLEAGAFAVALARACVRRRAADAPEPWPPGAGSSSSSARPARRPSSVPRCTGSSTDRDVARPTPVVARLARLDRDRRAVRLVSRGGPRPAACDRASGPSHGRGRRTRPTWSRSARPTRRSRWPSGPTCPGALALGAALVSRLRSPGERGAAAIALTGLGLTFGAAACRRSGRSRCTRACSTTTRPITRSRRSPSPASTRRPAGSSVQPDQ